MEYVEKHFPKSEFDETGYIEKLIQDIKISKVNLAREVLSKKHGVQSLDLQAANEIAKEIEN
jgi:hypothetical protein